MLILSRFYVVLSWAIAIFILISWPMPPYKEDGFTIYDKFVHIILFGGLAFLFIWALKARKKFNFKPVALAAFFLGVIYSVISEYIQGFVPGRDVSSWDLLAGTIGSALGVVYAFFMFTKPRPRLLLHICCIGCGAYVSQLLKNDFRVILYFYNPNIFPESEYKRRLAETKRIAKKFSLKLIEGGYNHQEWLELVRGHEKDPERGERCRICYYDRLKATARLARQMGIKYFTTTLTISPHKDAKAILQFGQEIGDKYNLEFLAQDFKKKDGFKKSVQLSRELSLYRQNYCGCEFSRR